MKFIKNLLKNLFKHISLVSPVNESGDLESYERSIKSGKFKNHLVFGLSDYTRSFYKQWYLQMPGALYCGSMGSGKSEAMKFTITTTMLADSENSFFIFVDPLKGMNEYSIFFSDATEKGEVQKCLTRQNACYAINDESKIVPVLELLYDELVARKEAFSKAKAKHFIQFEEKTQRKVARIFLCIEEFHKIPVSKYVKYFQNSDMDGSVASKLKDIMKVGRSYGINCLFATQRAVGDEVPSSLKVGLVGQFAFFMSNHGDASALNLPHALDVPKGEPGRCAYDRGFLQFPYFEDNVIRYLLKKYYKPLKGELFSKNVEYWQTALENEGSSGLVKIKPLTEVVQFANQYRAEDVVERVLKEFKVEIQPQTNPAYAADFIGTKYDVKYAIKILKEKGGMYGGGGGSDEYSAGVLKKGAEILKCNKIIVISLDGSVPSTYKNIDKEKVIILEKTLLDQFGKVMDQRTRLENEGKFNELYLEFKLSDPKDLGIVEKEVQSEDLSKKIEDVKVKVFNDFEKNLTDAIVDDFLAQVFPDAAKKNQDQKKNIELINSEERSLLKTNEIQKRVLEAETSYNPELANNESISVIRDRIKNNIKNN